MRSRLDLTNPRHSIVTIWMIICRSALVETDAFGTS
ncbi:hypothetical protein RB187 [Rhodopirellula baltica SH 1]|uniref:Uncharacterized protein n=1 Tax=Rhodopirellula baltica (strain DSM 10527 / NCIMB 13988 / SH1) TaxID=243090 RepID=Q7UZ50_RHOBA|nr:hypothetical protein RB187 [Rhodopirellula baltica SH 1]